MNLDTTNTALATDGQQSTADAATTVTTQPGEVTLDTPVIRGNTTITKVTIRKPRSGELRGTSLSALMQMDVMALCMLLPRVTMPTLTKPEIEAMEPCDLLQLGTEVVNFLLPRADRVPASQGT